MKRRLLSIGIGLLMCCWTAGCQNDPPANSGDPNSGDHRKMPDQPPAHDAPPREPVN